MKKYIISFGSREFYGSLNLLRQSCLSTCDEFIGYTEKDLDDSFVNKNSEIFKYRRGYGYWIWKPYLILKTFEKMNDGDVLFYSDAASIVISDLSCIFDFCIQNNGIYLFDNRDGNNNGEIWKNSMFTKSDTFFFMGCEDEKFVNGNQVDASYQLYQKNPTSISFLQEYLKYCEDINIVSDNPNVCGKPNFPDFRAHRHDQSILSILSIKHNIAIGLEPSEWGNHLSRPYPQLFNHHRRRIA